MITQQLTLSRLTTSTWGVSMTKARTVYNAIIRLAIIYASTVWRTFVNGAKHVKNIDSKLNVIQNKCFKIVTNAYKATSIKVFEAEAAVKPLFIHMNKFQVKYRIKLTVEQHVEIMEKASEHINRRLRNAKSRKKIVDLTPNKSKQECIGRIVSECSAVGKKNV